MKAPCGQLLAFVFFIVCFFLFYSEQIQFYIYRSFFPSLVFFLSFWLSVITKLLSKRVHLFILETNIFSKKVSSLTIEDCAYMHFLVPCCMLWFDFGYKLSKSGFRGPKNGIKIIKNCT